MCSAVKARGDNSFLETVMTGLVLVIHVLWSFKSTHKKDPRAKPGGDGTRETAARVLPRRRDAGRDGQ